MFRSTNVALVSAAQTMLHEEEFCDAPSESDAFFAGECGSVAHTPVGRVRLGHPLFSPLETRSFTGGLVREETESLSGVVFNDPCFMHGPGTSVIGAVVVFGSDCVDRAAFKESTFYVNSVDSQYTVLRFLNGTGIAPIVYYLSAPRRITSPFLFDDIAPCVAINATTRFLVTEKFGMTLEMYASEVVKDFGHSAAAPRRLLKVIRKAFDKLENLHAKGIIHGAIRASAIVLRDVHLDVTKIDENVDVLLTDFNLNFFPAYIGHPVHDESHRGEFLWGLVGERPAPRDDIFSLFLCAAHLLSGGNLINRMESLVNRLAGDGGDVAHRRITLYRILMHENLFAHSEELQNEAFTHMRIPPALRRELQAGMERILAQIRAVTHPDHRPDYRAIRRALEDIITRL